MPMKKIRCSASNVVDHIRQEKFAVRLAVNKRNLTCTMTTPRTRAQTANNPINVELKTKAFDERRALWTQEDEREEERLRAVGKTFADAILNTVAVQGDLQREDACIFCKELETFNFYKYFLIDET